MILRRIRETPRKVIGFRAIVFCVGLLYVLATTETIHTVALAFEALEKLYEAVQTTSGNSPTLIQQKEQNG